MLLPCDYLARVGYDHLLTTLGGPTLIVCDDDDDPGAYEAAEAAAKAADDARVLARLTDPEAKPVPRNADLAGAKWITGVITWPDRVPGLVTWAGQATLAKVITGHRRRLAGAVGDPLAVRGLIRTSKGEGPSGIDAGACPDAIDLGFSAKAAGVDVGCRPAVELLAVIGLGTVPLVSFAARECGFVHDGRLWRFAVESRDGGYYHRWGPLRPATEVVPAEVEV